MTTFRWILVSLCLLLFTSWLQAETTVRSAFFKTSDGIRLHYLEGGSGSAIVFVPGWTMPVEHWAPQIQYLIHNYHVIALDPRCQGESEQTTEGNFSERRAQDIKELVDHLGISSIVLVGWSLGVREALTYVKLFGTSTLRGLVLVDGGVWTTVTPEMYQARAEFLHDVQAHRAEFTANFVRSMYQKPQPSAYFAKIVAASLKTPTNTAVALLAEMYLWNDLRPILAQIRVPLLVAVRAQHRDQGEIVRSIVPSAQTEVFEDAGHALFVDDAERFNAVLESFLSRMPHSY